MPCYCAAVVCANISPEHRLLLHVLSIKRGIEIVLFYPAPAYISQQHTAKVVFHVLSSKPFSIVFGLFIFDDFQQQQQTGKKGIFACAHVIFALATQQQQYPVASVLPNAILVHVVFIFVFFI
ncbi:hypothetical protein [Parasitella parasitica]|uniref:Uncharacterized protein n=1 Tax=Parasitella parasitica TaxID=35722 RepID=A0A0B7MVK4_9FUNG|nr:hypothetical protein [Parasitella parasitica]